MPMGLARVVSKCYRILSRNLSRMKFCPNHKDTDAISGGLRAIIALAIRQLRAEFVFDVGINFRIALQFGLHGDCVDNVESQEQSGRYESHTT